MLPSFSFVCMYVFLLFFLFHVITLISLFGLVDYYDWIITIIILFIQMNYYYRYYYYYYCYYYWIELLYILPYFLFRFEVFYCSIPHFSVNLAWILRLWIVTFQYK
jgi:hypothetical protein